MSHRKPIESEPPLSPVVFHILLALATGERHGYDNHAPSRARYPSDHEARSRYIVWLPEAHARVRSHRRVEFFERAGSDCRCSSMSA